MAKTVLDVDRGLLGQAQEALGTPTLTATMNEALRRVVAQHAMERLLNMLESLDDEQVEILENVRDRAW